MRLKTPPVLHRRHLLILCSRRPQLLPSLSPLDTHRTGQNLTSATWWPKTNIQACGTMPQIWRWPKQYDSNHDHCKAGIPHRSLWAVCLLWEMLSKIYLPELIFLFLLFILAQVWTRTGPAKCVRARSVWGSSVWLNMNWSPVQRLQILGKNLTEPNFGTTNW